MWYKLCNANKYISCTTVQLCNKVKIITWKWHKRDFIAVFFNRGLWMPMGRRWPKKLSCTWNCPRLLHWNIHRIQEKRAQFNFWHNFALYWNYFYNFWYILFRNNFCMTYFIYSTVTTGVRPLSHHFLHCTTTNFPGLDRDPNVHL